MAEAPNTGLNRTDTALSHGPPLIAQSVIPPRRRG